MKRFLILLCSLFLALCLAACEKDPATVPTTATTQPTAPTTLPTTAPTAPTTVPTEPEHVHTPGAWSCDLSNHWRVCTECGETLDLDSHNTNNEWDICFTCDAEIKAHSEGYITMQTYEKSTKTTTIQYYDLLGNLLVTNEVVNTYTDSKNRLCKAKYEDGVLVYEENFVRNDLAIYELVSQTYYYQDGSRSTNEFDAYGNLIRETRWTASGDIDWDQTHIFTYSESGVPLREQVYEGDVLLCEREFSLVNIYSTRYYCAKEIIYNDDGTRDVTEYSESANIIAEYYIDVNGNLVDSSIYFDDTLCSPLYGTWQGTYTVDGNTFGIPIDLRYEVSLSFNAQGQMHAVITLNKEDVTVINIELIYLTYEAYGLTRAQTDQLFKEQLGMTVVQYVENLLNSEQLQAQMRREQQKVYYVLDQFIYIGNSWTAPMESIGFQLSGDTLILTYYNDEGITDTFTLTRSEN